MQPGYGAEYDVPKCGPNIPGCVRGPLIVLLTVPVIVPLIVPHALRLTHYASH